MSKCKKRPCPPSSSNVHLDSNLKVEIISSILGQKIKPYDKKRRGRAEDVLSVDEFHLHNLTGKRRASVKKPFINVDEFFDPDYDCDFTNLADSDKFTRGEENYKRPKGWYRMGLKVKGKYPDGDTWLGPNGWRNKSVPGEWPVSYHGTSLDGATGIIKSHYKAGPRARYGRGIYSTPNISIAEKELYAKTFTSKTTGKRYKVIVQNRINPKKRELCRRADYWLVPVKKGASAEEERNIVEGSIRPYGILIKELKDDVDEEDGESEEEGYDDDDDDNDDNYDDDEPLAKYRRYDDGGDSDNGDGEDDDDSGDGDTSEDDDEGDSDGNWNDEDDDGDDDDEEDDGNGSDRSDDGDYESDSEASVDDDDDDDDDGEDDAYDGSNDGYDEDGSYGDSRYDGDNCRDDDDGRNNDYDDDFYNDDDDDFYNDDDGDYSEDDDGDYW